MQGLRSDPPPNHHACGVQNIRVFMCTAGQCGFCMCATRLMPEAQNRGSSSMPGTPRAAIAARYDAALAGLVDLQKAPAGVESAHAVYAVLSDARDALQAALAEDGIAARAYYATPLHLMPMMRPYSAGPGSLPVTERHCARILALPIYADLDDAGAERVCKAARAGLAKPAAGP